MNSSCVCGWSRSLSGDTDGQKQAHAHGVPQAIENAPGRLQGRWLRVQSRAGCLFRPSGKNIQHFGVQAMTYASEDDTEELLRIGKMPKPLRIAAMLEKTKQWPLHGKAADCLREMYVLFQHCENEMRYAGWDKREADNYVRNDVYEQIKNILEKNT
jgi:hypothetical protein